MTGQSQIDLFLAKAAQDEYILEKTINDPQASTEIFGFHAQQAAEKLLKAILLKSGSSYPETHRLAELLRLIRKKGVSLPEKFDGLKNLTPFAVEFRYDDLPSEEEESIDREPIFNLIKELRQWTESFVLK